MAKSAIIERAPQPVFVPVLSHRAERQAEAVLTLQDESFLHALLPFTLAQARRYGEPLSLLCLAIDRLGGLRELLGVELADEAVRRVGASVVRMLRASDVVARMSDDRLTAVLPGAGRSEALTVAESVRAAVAEAGKESQAMPLLTASIGVASFPDHALDVPSLTRAALDALAEAQAQGRNRVAAV